MFEKGTIIIDRTGKIKGKTTGGTRPCTLEGCRGKKIGVRWEDGKLTWPCTAGLMKTKEGWKII
ncbi:MAG TPA: hypothetical protein P5136_01390 [Methanofastidiosum sp.]|nr:hypothetical protein [Methanofastidiosum sp.]